ncbi:MAG: MotA/TolQ/ExbB proton channel family protein [bacterium]
MQGEATARALAAGAPLATAGIFLFQSADENYEPRRSRTPLEVVEAGGAIAWVIVALGGLALLVLLARVALLAVARSPVDRLLAAIEPHVLARRYRAAAEHCERARGAGARVMAALARYLAAEHAEHERADLERVFAEGMLREEGRIDRLGSALTVIAAVAPLLGLLGTVTGMISTFDVITEFGTGNPKLLSGGISEALITTELGLVVAIPALLLGNLLNAWASALKAQVEQGALRLVNLARVGRVDAASAGTGAVEASPVPA